MDKTRPHNDQLANQTREASKNSTTYPKTHLGKTLIDKIAYRLALNLYLKTNDNSALRILGVSFKDISEIKRPRGQPKKTIYSDRQIVQLVYKQELQAGVRFTNVAGKENNECFIAVAEHQNVGVDQIVRQYKNVPSVERRKIKEWLQQKLIEHDELDKNRE